MKQILFITFVLLYMNIWSQTVTSTYTNYVDTISTLDNNIIELIIDDKNNIEIRYKLNCNINVYNSVFFSYIENKNNNSYYYLGELELDDNIVLIKYDNINKKIDVIHKNFTITHQGDIYLNNCKNN